MENEHSPNIFNRNKTRFKSFLKRSKAITPITHNKTDSFNVIYKINEQPNSKGICSTCLFGDAKDKIFYNRLVVPLLYNAKNIHIILPGWCLRVYLSTKIPLYIKNELINNNCEIYMMNEDPNHIYAGTLWRFLCASEPKPFIVCDADLMLHESHFLHKSINKHDINDWLKSDKIFFRIKVGVINNFVPITAGKWGGRPYKNGKPPFPDIKEKMEKYNHNWFGTDEAFLHKEVWPDFKKSNYTVSNNIEIVLCSIILWIIIVIIYLIICKKSTKTY